MHCSEAALLITALVDGELDLEQMDHIKAHLDMCEDCQERRHQEARLKAFLQERLKQVDPPAGLEQRIRECLTKIDVNPQTPPTPSGNRDTPDNHKSDNNKPDTPSGNALRLPLTILIVVLASMMGSMLVMKMGGGRHQPVASSPMATELAALHVAATGAGVLQVRENNPQALESWLTSHIAANLHVPDLSNMGLAPVGARALTMMETPMAMLLYRDHAATPSFPPVTVVQSPTPLSENLFDVQPVDVAGVPVYADSAQGIALAHFNADGMTWMLASNQSTEALLALSRRVLAR